MVDPEYRFTGDPEDRLIEEIGEFLQAFGKGKRFGWNNHHPNDIEKTTNFSRLHCEFMDIMIAYDDFRVKHGKKRLYTT